MNTTDNISQTLDMVFQIIMLLLPIIAAVATWFLRTYVKSAKLETDVAAIIRLANNAIDCVEDIDSRGELGKYLKMWNMPDDIINLTSDGLKKLNLAGKWLESELGRQGIQMTDEEAKAWIAAQFQSRVGDIGRDRGIAERTQEAASLLRALDQSGLIALPADATQVAMLGDAVATWVIGQLGDEEAGLLREQALAQFGSQLGSTPQVSGEPATAPLESQLADLARQSVQYVEQLKASHELTLPEMDIAVAWVLTEVTKRGLAVTAEQLAGAVNRAFGERG